MKERMHVSLFKRCLAAVFVCLFFVIGTVQLSAAAEAVVDYEALKGKRIGIQTGTILDQYVGEAIEDPEVVYFDEAPDLLNALMLGKVDAITMDEPTLRYMAISEPRLVYDKQGYLDMDYAYILNKDSGQALCSELNAFISACKEDGTLEEMQNSWFSAASADREIPDYEAFPATKGTIRMAVDGQIVPFIFMREGTFVGYEIELMARFCEAKGYALEVTNMKFSALIPGITSERYDIGAACITITEERAQSVMFSDPTYHGNATIAIRNDDAKTAENADTSFFASVRESFERTFLEENRYLLFLEGIGRTLLITLLSAFLGTALGFLIFLACRRGNAVANMLAGVFSWLMLRMPIIVFLMILYYIVFGKLSIGGMAVAVIGFTLIFGADVYDMIRAAVDTVDGGQLEAAYALGYTDRAAFFRYILPQAMPHFMPPFRGGLISLIKSTSVVGYVAVEDLTKVGDLVRSRTYEAFFPLIAVAFIYFVLAELMIILVNRMTLRFDAMRRKKEDILKGIETDD